MCGVRFVINPPENTEYRKTEAWVPRIGPHLGIGDVCISKRDNVHRSTAETRAGASSSTDVYQIDYDIFRTMYVYYKY